MEIKEFSPLPQVCVECQERLEGEKLGLGVDAYCYNCDYALERFTIVKGEVQ